jgi:hypothetical protein
VFDRCEKIEVVKFLRNIFTNSIAIAVAFVHWIVVLFAIYGEEHSRPFHFTDEPLLTQWLYWLNILPMLVAGIFLLPILNFFGESSFTLYFRLFLNFLTITFQWLIIGYGFANLIDLIKPKETNFSIN